MTHPELTEIAQQHGSPFYLFDRDAFVRNIRDFRDAFEGHYPDVAIGYSFKTNYLPYVCRLAHSLGAYAEVVSRLEVDLALKLGCPPSQIIFNGPYKREEDVEMALSRGLQINLDTFRELEAVEAFARSHPLAEVKLGLRLNIVLMDEEGNSHLQEGVAAGRFGFSMPDLEAAAHRLGQVPNIRVNALHGHTSSTSRSLWVYRSIARTLAEAAARHFTETVDTLNLGGGYFGRLVPAMGLEETPTYKDYATAIGDELRRQPWAAARTPRLVIEPGMAVVADTMSFVTQVFEVKEIAGRRLVVVDGTFFNVRPTLHRRPLPCRVVREKGGSGDRQTYSVVGATCMEKDWLLQQLECEKLARGDFLCIDNVGAYTLVLTPPFILPAPAVVACHEGRLVPIRRRQEFADFFRCCDFDGALEPL